MYTEREEWQLYFASICGWLLHPGRFRENATKITVSDMATLADLMLNESRKRWPDGQQQQK